MSPEAPTYGAASDAELEEILALQQRNVEENLAPAEAAAQGFVTLRHDLPLLRDLRRAAPQIVARVGGGVVGYALVMPPAFEGRFPELAPMFAELRRHAHRGRPVDAHRWFVMGQVCVARAFRGTGVFAGLYAELRARCSPRYDLVVTEVARRNARSTRAHEKVGFELLHRHADPDGEEWDLIVWDWSGRPQPSTR